MHTLYCSDFLHVAAIMIIFCTTLFFSLKMEAEKLAQEKTEIQRQYIMVRCSTAFFIACFFLVACLPCFVYTKLRLEHREKLSLYYMAQCKQTGKKVMLIKKLELNFALFFYSLQYYEMSYGLNVEMHKQVKKDISVVFVRSH